MTDASTMTRFHFLLDRSHTGNILICSALPSSLLDFISETKSPPDGPSRAHRPSPPPPGSLLLPGPAARRRRGAGRPRAPAALLPALTCT